MEATIIAYAFIYFVTNAFIAGLVYGNTPKIGVIMVFLFGMIIFGVYYGVAGIIALWWLFVNNTGLSFWYYYNFTKIYKNLSASDLQKMNENIDKRFKKDSRAYKAMKKYMIKVNKRHGFIYNQNIENYYK